MGEGIYGPPALSVMVAFLAISAILLIAGALMRQRGLLRSPTMGLIWACLIVAPVGAILIVVVGLAQVSR